MSQCDKVTLLFFRSRLILSNFCILNKHIIQSRNNIVNSGWQANYFCFSAPNLTNEMGCLKPFGVSGQIFLVNPFFPMFLLQMYVPLFLIMREKPPQTIAVSYLAFMTVIRTPVFVPRLLGNVWFISNILIYEEIFWNIPQIPPNN